MSFRSHVKSAWEFLQFCHSKSILPKLSKLYLCILNRATSFNIIFSYLMWKLYTGLFLSGSYSIQPLAEQLEWRKISLRRNNLRVCSTSRAFLIRYQKFPFMSRQKKFFMRTWSHYRHRDTQRYLFTLLKHGTSVK